MTKKKSDKISVENLNMKLGDFNHTYEQMLLFELDQPKDSRYSNTIELYDFMPKYRYGRVERIQERFLDVMKRTFECRGINYKMEVAPAVITDDDGKERYYYPSLREELVEDALRRFATAGQGMFLDDRAGVKFTLYELQKELKRNGHSYDIAQIKDALMICAKTNLTVKTEDGKNIFTSNLFETLGLQTREDWQNQGTNTKAFVRFNSLVTSAIKEGQFRLINYDIAMQYRSVISRQLHKRMSHHFTQASFHIPFNIRLSTILRDFGLTEYPRISTNLRDVLKALDDMVDKKVVLKYDVEKIHGAGKRNKMEDAKILIYPHPNLVSEVKNANNRQREVVEKIVKRKRISSSDSQ